MTSSLVNFSACRAASSYHLSVLWPSCSTPSFWRSWSIFASCHKIVAALAYIALANLDRVHLFSFDDGLKIDSGLGRGKSQFHRLLKFLTGLKPTDRATALYPAIQRFTQAPPSNYRI